MCPTLGPAPRKVAPLSATLAIFITSLAISSAASTSHAGVGLQSMQRRGLLNSPKSRAQLTMLRVPKGGFFSDASSAVELEDQCGVAFEWMANLGAPAALVGGAALASFFELREQLTSGEGDGRAVRVAKNFVLIMLLSAFACEIACVFLTTVAGDMIMSNGDAPRHAHVGHGGFLNKQWGRGFGQADCFGKSPGGVMQREMEFEFAASRVTFFQGIMSWILAITVELGITGWQVPVPTGAAAETNEGRALLAKRQLYYCASSSVAFLFLWMLAFFNWHLPFYQNYFQLVHRLLILTWERYIAHGGAPRFTALAALAPLVASIWFGIQAMMLA